MAHARRHVLPALLILLAGFWAYHNSFGAVFLFDDHRHIVHHAEALRLQRAREPTGAR
ncbi:MAG: hypothetical protein HY599_05055 [Candidatus Omnitrophica bacterium]|nr:hypothetical protein [Candidatus Omnitrophota bacterium]